MVRVAQSFVRDHETAEEVAQETWLGFLKGLDRFEGRSSLKTWLFGILANIARTRGVRENRSVPFSAIQGDDPEGPTVAADRFFPAGHPSAGAWSSIPDDWEAIPEHRLLANETRATIDSAIAGLSDLQRAVIELRDIAGWSSEEVCNVLSISETNQRVLLHRARAKVRLALETYLRASG
ncbi:MAG: RNA polymerase sigma factor [Dehalococcoidia bacterium]|nr:RNA polymerase sigma factor [Dehalococcoidia bacterium]